MRLYRTNLILTKIKETTVTDVFSFSSYLHTTSAVCSNSSFSRNRAMTESPRRPLMSDLSKTGYRSYTSPSDRLSKRLGASMPNLENPDTVTPISSNRPASLRKMTPDTGQH